MRTAAALLGLLLLAAGVRAGDDTALDTGVAAQVRRLAEQGVRKPAAGVRVAVEVGRLDPRLKLAPCDRIEPHLPPGTRLWGRTRIGLRCAAGPVPWNVYLPITVKVYGRTLVARANLPSGSTLAAGDLAEAEADLAAEAGAPIADAAQLISRTLVRDVSAGSALRETHLQPRSWFAIGDAVRIVAVGNGWQVVGEGIALAPGLDGRSVRVRTESGRIVSGRASGPRRIEVIP